MDAQLRKYTPVGLWVFKIVQWNVMGRLINIDPLGFYNLINTGGADSILVGIIQTRNKRLSKHVSKKYHANPIKPIVYVVLVLSCHFRLFQDKFNQAS
jgi:hypothetical protein